MKNLSKLILFLTIVLSVFTVYYSLLVSQTNAQIPPPIVPCSSTDDPEFNSLRPYQASPCGNAPQSKFCGNKIIITESQSASKTFPESNGGCDPTKEVNWVNDKDYWIDLSEVELPILGNTQEVQNSQSANDIFNDAQKMNEYASWYLNGVINRAEYGKDKNTDSELVNFSGPLNKLLPSIMMEAQKIKSIENADKEIEFTDPDSGETVKSAANHDQIVVCNKGGKPIECYPDGGGSGAEGEVLRLRDWSDGSLSFFNTFYNWLATDIWNKRYPPLPWQFKEEILYHKAYNEWRGKTCAIVPIYGLVCIDNPLVTNKWADLYPYVPMANTADRQYKMPIFTTTIQGNAGVTINQKEWTVLEDGEPLLYYPHAYEVRELSELLNTTYVPGGAPDAEVDLKTSEINSYNLRDEDQCRNIVVRTNEGDDLFPIGGGDDKHDIGVNVYFEVKELPLVSCIPYVDQFGNREYKGKYYGEVTIEIHTDPVQIPNIDEIWKSTVSGSESTFRKIFPKVEKGAPVECIADIPTVSKAVYTPVEGTSSIGVKSLTHPEEKYDPEDAKLYFPHLGSVYEYFLKGIQTALRPKGYGDPIVNGTLCESNIPCGELPDLPKASGSCSLGGISSKVGDIPPSLKDIVEAAAETYKTPPNLILGAIYGEGGFNSAQGNSTGEGYEWTEENVVSWATCETIPNCSGPESSIVGLSSQSVWDEIAENIKDDLKELDPNRTEPDPCNLLDMIYGISWTLSRSATGTSGFTGHTCFGLQLNTGQSISTAGTCSWDPRDYETSIRWWEFGTEFTPEYQCATLKNSCSLGGMGVGTSSVNCPGGDNCETINNRYYGEESHNGCVWDVAHGQ